MNKLLKVTFSNKCVASQIGFLASLLLSKVQSGCMNWGNL